MTFSAQLMEMIMLRSSVLAIKGSQHGPINRLIDPSRDVAHALKPFVFLDYFNAAIQPGFGFGMHPHSGIATLTWQPGSDVQYQDTTGQSGILKAGGLEWMNAGGGAWHQGHLLGSGFVTGLQLWVAMPPGVENGPSEGHYVPPAEVPVVNVSDDVRLLILLGRYSDAIQSPINPHQDMNYWVVQLAAGASWQYSPPTEHNVAWAMTFDGNAQIQEQWTTQGQLWVLGDSGELRFSAGDQAATIVFGTAKKHNHDLVLGSSSVHTSYAALQQGENTIRAIGRSLQQKGHL